MPTLSKRASEKNLTRDEVRKFVAEASSQLSLKGKRVLIIIPDGTRTMPMPLMFELLQEKIAAQAAACDYLVALGTHPAMNEAQLSRMFGRPVAAGICDGARIFNHRWDLPDTFSEIGVIPAADVTRISGGVLQPPTSVRVPAPSIRPDRARPTPRP